jgi:predicted permease
MRLLRRVLTLLRLRRVDDEIRRELDFHVQMEAADRERRGASRDEAQRLARRDFGGEISVREEVRDVRGMTFWESLVQDVRFGARTLRRSPGYTLAAIAILGLGIGANTAMFSVLDGVLLKPLPFANGHELVLVQQSAPQSNIPNANVSIFELYDYRRRLQAIRDLVEYHQMSFTLLNQGEPDRIDAAVVSANFFEMLGVKPIHGRTFAEHEDDLGAEAVLVLSHEYWQQKFGGDPAVVGRVLEMNNKPHTVVGVLPSFPQYPAANDVYMPTSACPFRARDEAQPQTRGGHRAFAGLQVFGRLVAGMTTERAATEVAGIAAQFPEQHPADYQRVKGLTGRVSQLEDELVVGARDLLLALAGVTGLVLLIACANVANLSLARTAQRRRELAVRSALGAGRTRLFRQLVTESIMVSLAGGLVGLALASLSIDLLVGFVSRFTPRVGQIAIDSGVLWFTIGASVLTGVLFGTAPALAAWKRGLVQAVRDGAAQAGEAPGRRRLRSALVVAQVAVSFVLLVGAALLLESLGRLSAVPLGYNPREVMTASLLGNFTRIDTPQRALEMQTGVLTRLRAAPGVRSAAVTSIVPLTNVQPGIRTVRLEGSTGSEEARTAQATQTTGSEGYFETLGVPVLAGRAFRESDDATAPLVAMINRSLARAWQGREPVGTRFQLDRPLQPGTDPPWVTVIGVVADSKLYGAERAEEPQYFMSFRQTFFGGGRLLVAGDGDPIALIPAIKAAVHGTDAQIPVEDLQTLEQLRTGRLATPGLTAALLTIFAVVALVITLAGIAGVIGTTVSQRTREFGLRMALGATRASVVKLVLGQGLVMAAIGIAIGLGGALAVSHRIAPSLFQTRPTDPLAFGGVAALFVVAVLIASFGPARRATSIDPLTSLRSE